MLQTALVSRVDSQMEMHKRLDQKRRGFKGDLVGTHTHSLSPQTSRRHGELCGSQQRQSEKTE
jgi:hypothetical protein